MLKIGLGNRAKGEGGSLSFFVGQRAKGAHRVQGLAEVFLCVNYRF